MSYVSLAAAARAVLAAAIVLVTGAAHANLVTNGGFETGSFAGWTQFGNTAFTTVLCPGPDPVVQEGNCAARFGPPNSIGGIFQTLATTAGALYQIDFWLLSVAGGDFEFNWDGGANEFALTGAATAPYTLYSFTLAASSASTDLRFGFRNDPSYFFFDAVSVVAVVARAPEPGMFALLSLGLAGLVVARRRR